MKNMIIDKTNEESGGGYQVLGTKIKKSAQFTKNNSTDNKTKYFFRKSLKFVLLCALGFVARIFLMAFLFWRGITWLILAANRSFQFWEGAAIAVGIFGCFTIALILLFRLFFKKTREIHYAFWGVVCLLVLFIYLLDILNIFESCSFLGMCI
jgi:hypothetical protein